MRRVLCCALALVLFTLCGCRARHPKRLVIGSKFFTEQVVLAELLAQHIEAKTGVPVERKTNLGGTLLVQKALLAGQLDLYVEYTGTALTAVLREYVRHGDSRRGRTASAFAEDFGDRSARAEVADRRRL